MGPLSQAAHRRHPVRVAEDVGALRRAVAKMAAGCGGVPPGHAELVATELASNLARHATRGGYVLYRADQDGIELIAVDDGPGLPPSVAARWLAPAGQPPPPLPPLRHDGGLGVGLAAVERYATTFDVFTGTGGTVVLARLGADATGRAAGFRWGGVSVALDGSADSGDSWAVVPGAKLGAVMVDGLGHGPAAATAAAAAISALPAGPLADPAEYLRLAHAAMQGTRGGVLAACLVDPAAGVLNFAGVGNIAGRVFIRGDSESLTGRDGTIGTHAAVPSVRVYGYSWGCGATLILVSDGIRSGWDPRGYRSLLGHHPLVVAATLQRDYQRGTDDACVLVVQDARDGRDEPHR